MSLATILQDLATAMATDYKQLRSWMTGSPTGSLTSLTTTNKTSLVDAINEVKAGNSGAPAAATTSATGVIEIATLAEVATGTDSTRAVTPAGVRQERDALKTELLGGAGPAYDTLKELQDAIAAAEETSVIDALTTVVGQKADKTEIYTRTELGNIDVDLVAVYTAAKA